LPVSGAWAEGRAAQDLVHQAQLDLAIALAAQLGAQVAGPQAAFFHFLLQGPHQLDVGGVLHVERAAQQVLQRLHALAHEFVHPVELGLEVSVGFKRPAHGRLLLKCLMDMGYGSFIVHTEMVMA
jgi:hypothetical protein